MSCKIKLVFHSLVLILLAQVLVNCASINCASKLAKYMRELVHVYCAFDLVYLVRDLVNCLRYQVHVIIKCACD